MTFFAELKRRNVVRVGAAYVVLAWVIAQVAEFAFENFGAPDWALKTMVVGLLLGLPLVLFFAWAFELTPEGVKREKDVDRTQSITAQTGRKLDRTIIAVLLVAVAWFAWDKFYVETADVVENNAAVGEATVDTSGIIPAATEKSVAVLPFVAMSSGPDDEFFADGLTEEILNSLAQLPELLVTARTSAFSFKGQEIPVQEIAAALGVKHIVEGSVRRSGDRLRVTAQLIRAADGFHLWSENYDSSSTDAIAVQENIAEKIAAALDVVLDDERRQLMRNAGLRDVEAFTDYQKGMALFNRAHGEIETVGGLRKANTYFEKVIERVPDFSQVYGDHSDLYVHILADDASNARVPGVTDDDVANAYAGAIADYEAAVLQARSPELRQLVELDYAFISGNWRGLTGRIELALASERCTNSSNWLTVLANSFGYSEEALPGSYEILTCDPRRSLSWFNTARFEFWAGDIDKAIKVAREGTTIAPGGWLDGMLVRALIADGQYDAALVESENRIKDAETAITQRALIAARQGDQQGFDELMQEFFEINEYGYFWQIILYAWGGHRDDANRVAALIDEHFFAGVTLTQVIQWCSCGAPWDLEATPNFAALIREGNLPWPPASPLNLPLKDW
jgi:adenylate cyclase